MEQAEYRIRNGEFRGARPGEGGTSTLKANESLMRRPLLLHLKEHGQTMEGAQQNTESGSHGRSQSPVVRSQEAEMEIETPKAGAGDFRSEQVGPEDRDAGQEEAALTQSN